MNQFLTLLKYLDRSKMSGSAVQEIVATLGLSIDAAVAERIATAFRTRGQAGLLSCTPDLLALVQSFKAKRAEAHSDEEHRVVITYQCKHCGMMGRIDAPLSQLEGE
jgi:hypothetical protein